MGMTFRKACRDDLPAVWAIYEAVHTQEEQGLAVIGWKRDVYPTRETARQALEADELYVGEIPAGPSVRIAASARINHEQMPVYAQGKWEKEAEPDRILVMHTLTVAPKDMHRGYGEAFVRFFESLAAEKGATELRMDTNARNARARALYARLGYREVGTVPCTFQGLSDVSLVLLEKGL